MMPSRASLYRICTAVILIGFVMLIQPISMFAFTWGLPVLLGGVILHAVLDHLNDWGTKPKEQGIEVGRTGP
jgi:hypothetical protein